MKHIDTQAGRRILLSAVAMAAMTAASQASAADAQSAPATGGQTASKPNGLEEIVVTARRRDENLQKVPVAVSVISAAAIENRGSFTPYDIQSLAAGVSVVASTGDNVTVNYSIRGQTQTYGTLFSAVVTYFNEVPVTRMAQGNFFDISNIQILRGPQGVLFGRVTDGGNVMIAPQRPTNKFEGYGEVKVGDFNLHNFEGALNIPLIKDKLLVRGAFELDRRDGYTKNTYNGADLDNVHSDAFRFSALFTPVSGFENYTVVNYQHIDQNGVGSVISAVNPTALSAQAAAQNLFAGAYSLTSNGTIVPYQSGLTALSPASYVAAIESQLARQQALGPRRVYQSTPSFYRLKNLFVTNSTSIDISDAVKLKNIFGYTTQRLDSTQDFVGDNSGLIYFCSSACAGAGLGFGGANLPKSTQRQFSDELRLAGHSFGSRLNWTIGLYADKQDPDGNSEDNVQTLGVLQRVVLEYDHTRSKAVFASGEYDLSSVLPGLKVNAGYRYTEDRDRSFDNDYIAPIYPASAQAALLNTLPYLGIPAAYVPAVAYATAYPNIPYGQCVTIGAFSAFGPFKCTDTTVKSHANTWTAGASYQISPNQLVYARGSRGYRPGGVNGAAPVNQPPTYQPDYDTSVELGFKGDFRLGDMPVRTNIALYHDDYSNIQKQVIVPAANGTPTNVIENIVSATIKGIEFEGTIKPTDNLSVQLNYAYTDAKYKNQPTSGSSDPCNPANFTIQGYCTSNLFAYVPKHAVTLGANYTLPIAESLGKFRFGGSMHYRSRMALLETSQLNPNSINPSLTTLDLNASWNSRSIPIEITLFMTNVTNALYRVETADLTQNSSLGVAGNYYAPPRMFGAALKYRFGSN